MTAIKDIVPAKLSRRGRSILSPRCKQPFVIHPVANLTSPHA